MTSLNFPFTHACTKIGAVDRVRDNSPAISLEMTGRNVPVDDEFRDAFRPMKEMYKTLETFNPTGQLYFTALVNRPSADPNDLVAHGWPALRELCERYVAVGFSKLVLVPFTEPENWDDELAAGSEAILPIQK